MPGSEVTCRQFHENTIQAKKTEWSVKAAVEALTPPPFDDVLKAIHAAQLDEDDATDWLSVQLASFFELSRQRGRGQTIQPLTFVEIEAYQRVNKIDLDVREIENILTLDEIFLAHCNKMAQEHIDAARAKAGG